MESSEIRFGRFRLDLRRRTLLRDDQPVRLGGRPLDILCALASAGGDVLTKDELMARLWSGHVVEEGNLYVHVSALRRALADRGDGHSYVVTVPGRGYRLAGLAGSPETALSFVQSVPMPDKPSIAVLPFANLSGDLKQDYFAHGVVEEVITALSRIRWLVVIASNSSFAYKGQAVDPRQLGRDLGARYVLEGSARKADCRVRITVRLTDAITGTRLWSDRFDGLIEDGFELQDKVAASVAGIIEPALQAAEIARSIGRPTEGLTAHDLYLRAYAMLLSTAKLIPAALDLMEQAIARDPDYGPALAWAAICCYRLVLDGRSEVPAAHRFKGIDFARRALEVAGDDPETRANAAVALAYFGEDIEPMTAVIDRALALNPNFARGWSISGMRKLWAGAPDIAIEHAETALRLSPRSRVGTPLLAIGAAHFLTRRFDEAIPKLLLAIQDDPSFPEPYRFLTGCYSHLGKLDDARDIIQRLQHITSVVIPNASHLRNVDHRELFLSGLRLAACDSK